MTSSPVIGKPKLVKPFKLVKIPVKPTAPRHIQTNELLSRSVVIRIHAGDNETSFAAAFGHSRMLELHIKKTVQLGLEGTTFLRPKISFKSLLTRPQVNPT
jgi:outer membrane protein W